MSCGCINKLASKDYARMFALAKATAKLEKGDVLLVKNGSGCYRVVRPSAWNGDIVKTMKYYPKTGYVKAI